MPTGVRMPGRQHVDAVLDRHRPGVRACRGIGARASISSCSSSKRRRGREEPRRRSPIPARPAPLGSVSTTVVSTIESGAGSVGVSARPALPKTRSTSGKLAQDPVLDLQDALRLGHRDARERGRHVEERALVERRHELGAEPEVDRAPWRPRRASGERERGRAVAQHPAADRLVDGEQHAADGMALLGTVAADGDARSRPRRASAGRKRNGSMRVKSMRSAGSSVIASTRRDRHREVLRVGERLEEPPLLVDEREDRQERDRDHEEREEDRRARPPSSAREPHLVDVALPAAGDPLARAACRRSRPRRSRRRRARRSRSRCRRAT